MRLIVLCVSTVILSGAAAFAARPDRSLRQCLHHAARAADPGTRDENRIRCVKAFSRHLNALECARAARGLEYSFNAERMKAYCAFELKREANAGQCLKIARSMDYGSSRDELVWGCLRRLNARITPKECRALVDVMVFPAQKARARTYCANEIQAVLR